MTRSMNHVPPQLATNAAIIKRIHAMAAIYERPIMKPAAVHAICFSNSQHSGGVT
jgi:hypothetical protein